MLQHPNSYCLVGIRRIAAQPTGLKLRRPATASRCSQSTYWKSEIVIADEPTSALTVKIDRFRSSLPRNKEQDSTLIFVSHDEHIARQFDHVAIGPSTLQGAMTHDAV